MSESSQKLRIALAEGDGIGPEIMAACLDIFEAAGVMEHVAFVPAEMGERVFAAGNSMGISDEGMRIVEDTGLVYKGPMGTPVGKGGKSINVTLRKMYGAFANVRHFQSLPGVETVYSKAGVPIDVVIVRENIEDTYGGIEHRLTADVVECKRLISAPGCDQVHREAFETARRLGIKKVHCGHKANIMKMSDGLFLERFKEIAKEYPEIETGDVIIDALCMNLVLKPQAYDMVVLPNLQGDIVSDLAAGLVGGLGFAPSANIGHNVSIFEAVHGTAPDIAGKGIANPTSLLLSGILMLRHIGLRAQANTIENALMYTLEQGVHTGDFGANSSKPAVGTREFGAAIAANLGKDPATHTVRPTKDVSAVIEHNRAERPNAHTLMRTFTDSKSELVGCDIYLDTILEPTPLAEKLGGICEGTPFKLTMMSNRGTQVWPSGSVYTEIVDYYRCRFELRDMAAAPSMEQAPLIELLGKIAEQFGVTDFQPLKWYDGKPGYSLAQGQ
ncbi:MAG: isocitrate/isopropylmalate family dehydrogenase [Phycisphaerales bacterium JB060]